MCIVAKAILCGLLWRKQQQRVYPFFVAFITFQVAESMALLPFARDSATYFYIYWVTAAVDVVLKLLVLTELFHDVYQAELLERVVVWRFYALLTILAAVSFALAFTFPSHYPVRMMAVIHTADAGACVMLSLGFVAILIGARIEGVYWLNRSLGIGFGLLLYLPLRALIDVLEMPARRVLITRLNFVEMTAFMGSVLIWTKFFVRPEIEPVKVPAAVLANYAASLKQSE
jgi:hypothetical protein